MMDELSIVKKFLSILKDPARHARGYMALDKDGNPVDCRFHPQIEKFCLVGLLWNLTQFEIWHSKTEITQGGFKQVVEVEIRGPIYNSILNKFLTILTQTTEYSSLIKLNDYGTWEEISSFLNEVESQFDDH